VRNNKRIVQVYWNSHKRCYSVRDKKTRKVVDHTSRVFLENAVPVVYRSGLARKIRTGVKNVYAVIEGKRIKEYFDDGYDSTTIGFKGDHFGSVEGWDRYQRREKLVSAKILDLGVWSTDQDENFMSDDGSPRIVGYGCRFEKIA
jgi:hypothetical protein